MHADPDGLIFGENVWRVGIRIGIHGDGGYAELTARTNDPDGNLAPVRDQNSPEHLPRQLTG